MDAKEAMGTSLPDDLGDGEEVCTTLPDELVEKIVAMMPFPYMFKARCLSKLWLARFSSLSSTSDEEKKRLASSFQSNVREWSHKWPTFCPVYISKEDFIAYDRAADSRRQMPSLSFLPDNALSNIDEYIWINRSGELGVVPLHMEGALLCLECSSSPGSCSSVELCVTNILTRSWKYLPHRPHEQFSKVLFTKLVSETSSESTYKVIVFCKEHEHKHYSTQIYDSKPDSWNSKKFIMSDDSHFASEDCHFGSDKACLPDYTSAYLNGVFYMMGTNQRQRNLQRFHVLALKVGESTLEELTFSVTDGLDLVFPGELHLVACNGNLLMIADTAASLLVMKIDLQTLELLHLSRGPPTERLEFDDICAGKAVSDGNCIFLEDWFRDGNPKPFVIGGNRVLGMAQQKWSSRVLAYNVEMDEWSSFPVPPTKYDWSCSTFQPGLSPFAAV